MPARGGLITLFAILFIKAASAQIGHSIINNPPVVAAQSSGECFNYRLPTESADTDYFYTCCGQLGEATVKTDTKIKVPILNYDCNPSRLTAAEPTQERRFTCNDKESAERLCNRRWGWLSTDDCWVWSVCFEEACKLGSAAAELVCGDGRCDEYYENTESCPLDCCPMDNPDTCIIKNNTCSNACCGESTCCQGTAPVSVSSDTFWLIVGSVVAGVFCLFYCCCFCCCCCCRKLYDSMFNTSKKRRHSFMIAGTH